ncbi:MAG: FAD-dependent oxidoreductase [Planctomycetes bacterium]|nr:FAD-dependent oxidoreductase [Planctomycetota bacterium]
MLICRFLPVILIVGTLWNGALGADEPVYDVVVYGGTSGGVTAAIQAARMGKSVVLIEPTAHIGGLTSGGLGATDIGNKAAIGGLSRDFYRKVGAYYRQASAWKHGSLETYERKATEDELWMFEPHVAEQIFREWLAEYKVPIVRERFELNNGVKKEGPRITAIQMESGKWISGRMFIDATYEGDVMAKAGCRYHIGREANSVYGETLNGVQVARAHSHQFIKDVDPYVKPGDPASGLLPLIQPGPLGKDGDGDSHVQAYNFRMCTTDVAENRRPWPKPDGYDPARYELLLRNCEAGDHRVPWNPIFMPNRKTDTNNNFAISTDYIGANYEYPDGDYQTRDRIYREHVLYQQGLMYTLANNPRVPESVRAQFQKLGLARDEFQDNDNWPHQMYVREARRLISEYVMTQHHCQRKVVCEDPVGMGAYNMDSHNVHRYVTADGKVRNEGDIQVGVSPYPISYQSIRPRREECENLLVPVCLAASHIAYGSIRMEPVFMVLGQSAATAACQAIDAKVAVQAIDYSKLKARLVDEKQVLEWTGPRKSEGGIDPKTLPGIVIDNTAAELKGEWSRSSSIPGYIGTEYLHDADTAKGTKSATFSTKIPTAGKYDIRIAYTANPNRATNIPVSITTSAGTADRTLNQREVPNQNGFQTIETRTVDAGDALTVTISTAGTNGHVIVDAIQIVPASAKK